MPTPTRRTPTRTLGLAAAGLLTLGLVTVPTAATATPAATTKLTATSTPSGTTINGFKSATGRIAKSNTKLLGRTDRAMTNVMVKLDVDPAASYRGGLRGYAATSPTVTGKKFDKASAATKSYVAHVNSFASSAAARIRSAVPSTKILKTYSIAYGGLLVRMPAADAKKLLEVRGVAAVQADTMNHPLSDSAASAAGAGLAPNDTAAFVGADKVWPSLGGRDLAGEGVLVGVLDTGVWPEHPMLADTGMRKPAGGPWACEFGDGSDPLLGAAFTCNNKLVGAYAFLDANIANNGAEDGEYCDLDTMECSARDSDGHGTHTTTTAVGDHVDHADVLGVDRGPISGIAPGASTIQYRVCLESGCATADSVSAVQQAIEDGVDVINFSISGGSNAYSDPVELAFLDAFAAGITVNASAGNEGPGAGTANHAGPWVTTVAASTPNRAFESKLVLTSAEGDTFTKVGSTITQGVSGKRVVLATDVRGHTRDALCQKPFAPGSLKNKVVICERGVNARVEKGYNAMLGDAAGMILYNPTKSDTETDNHWLPAIHLEGPNDKLVAFVSSHTDVRATWSEGKPRYTRGDVMAGFSSRGPLGDFLKPDVTAPGVQVLAGHTPTPVSITVGPPGQYYQAIAGTSMSSPHAAGVSALVKAAHPRWSPGQIKSALMTSSLQSVLDTNGKTAADPWDRGAGSIRANRAVTPSVTFNVSANAYYKSATDPLHRVDLNTPSINVNPLAGSLRTTRTVKNVTSQTETYTVIPQTTGGVTISASPSTFTLAPNAKQSMSILIDGTSASSGWHFGSITIRAGSGTALDAVVPVAVNVGPADVTLSQSCDESHVLVGGTTTCTVTAQNLAATAADATIRVAPDAGVDVTNVTHPAHATSDGALWHGTLSPSLPPEIESITPGGSQAGGYLELSDFGIGAAAGFGDETIGNFTVDPFQYGGETYDRIGVDSNGYLVVGGGSSEDNECCTIPDFPNAARPNNVLAPYWTDLSLDPASGGGAIRVGQLTDGVNDYLVVEWDKVKTYGTGGSGVENSFQIWITLGSEEHVSFAYGTLNGIGANTDAAYGAENRDGSSGVNIAEPSSDTDYTVNAGTPTPGGSVTFSYDASSEQAGVYHLLTTLNSPVIRSTVTATSTLTVNK